MRDLITVQANEKDPAKIAFAIQQICQRLGVPLPVDEGGTGLTITRAIIQIVQVNTATQTSVTGTTFTTTAVAASITPKSASNKVLVIVAAVAVSNTANTQCIVKLRRAGTDLPPVMLSGGSASTAISAGSLVYLDSPATTSATTYDTQVASDTVGADAYFPYAVNGATGTMILIEVAP